MIKRLKDCEKIEIVKKYQKENYNCHQLADMYNICVSSVCRLLKRRGIQVKRMHQFERKYTLNQSYFDNIDSEDKAYFLGFMYADGYNCEEKNFASLTLQERDIAILNKFNKLIESNRPLNFQNVKSRKPNHQNQYRLSISSLKISKRLAELGCVQKKSLILQFPTPNQVPNHLLRHFVRGYFDGDGCIYLPKNLGKMLCNIGSSVMFNTYLKDVLLVNLSITCRLAAKANHHENHRLLVISGRLQCKKFLDWIYKDSIIYLDRKYSKYQELCSTFLPH